VASSDAARGHKDDADDMTVTAPLSERRVRDDLAAVAPAPASPVSAERTAPARFEAPTVTAETLRDRWTAAFDAAQGALSAAALYLPPDELRERAGRLEAERPRAVRLLRELARDEHRAVTHLHVALAPWEAQRLLGLPPGVHACVFNADGVLIGSAALHAAAWTETFDEFIARRIERTGGRFAPFNARLDYPAHIHGRPRLDGVRTFLASRGISLPAGDPSDAPGTETVHGLANRKNQALLRLLDEHPLTAYEGSRHYLELAQDAGLRRAVVSASANTQTMLERAGLAHLIDARVDGRAIVEEHLHARPAPDVLLAACRRLEVEPQEAAVFETTAAGVQAARAAGFARVVGVDHTGNAKALADGGADLVVSGLAELLDRQLAA
jgi:HAD superfamily hydrolase (TIGR01509 family)